MTDSDGKCIYSNPISTKHTGLTFNETLGDGWVAGLHPDDRETVFQNWEKMIQSNGRWGFEYRCLSKEGKTTWVYGTANKIEDKNGKTTGYVGVNVDITERKKAEEEKQKLKQELHQSEKMQAIGQLAGGIAHDFNNQLASILGYVEMIRENVENDAILTRWADNSILGIKRAADLTTQLLAFSHKGKYITTPVDLHRIIFEVVNMLSHTIDKRITIQQELRANPATTLGDPSQIQSAILNLALNARDAMPSGGKLIFSTDIIELNKEYCNNNPFDITPGSYIEIHIIDTGTGMSKETKKHIFEPFFTTKAPGKGTGMGLAAVYGTIKNALKPDLQ